MKTKLEIMEEYFEKFESYRREFSSSGWDHSFSFDIDCKFDELSNEIRKEVFEEMKKSRHTNKAETFDFEKGVEYMKKNCCPKCGVKMKNAYDETLEGISPYLWEPQCKCFGKNIRISKG